MWDVVGKRGWYFLFSTLVLLPGLISMIIPSGWISLDSGLKAGIDFTFSGRPPFRASQSEDGVRKSV